MAIPAWAALASLWGAARRRVAKGSTRDGGEKAFPRSAGTGRPGWLGVMKAGV